MSPEERWLPVVGWAGSYEVSDHGRVRSLSRVTTHPHSGYITVKGRILSLRSVEYGYQRVDLKRPGYRMGAKVHRLVAQAFVPGEEPGLEVCHNDGDASNNHASNLRWDTHAANMRDAARQGSMLHANRGKKK